VGGEEEMDRALEEAAEVAEIKWDREKLEGEAGKASRSDNGRPTAPPKVQGAKAKSGVGFGKAVGRGSSKYYRSLRTGARYIPYPVNNNGGLLRTYSNG